MFSPRFNLTIAMGNALAKIERARGFLDAATLSQEWLTKMQNKALILEAHYTTHIEGTTLTLEQAEQLWEGKKLADTDPDDVKELLNYKKAFALLSNYLHTNAPVTEGLIREIHKKLVAGVRGNAASPGAYRKIQNYVVNSQTRQTVYTPPPAYEVAPMMAELVQWINQEETIHPILVSGIAQFQLVHIHPFLDGNGRTARLLSTLCLYRKDYDFKQLFTISEYYDRNRADYYKAIQSVRDNDMDMTPWLNYFTQGLAEQMQEIKNRGEIVIRTDVLAKQYHLSNRQQEALYHLLQYGELTIQGLQQIFPLTPRRSLQRDIKILLDKKLITGEGKTNQRIYKLVTQF